MTLRTLLLSATALTGFVQIAAAGDLSFTAVAVPTDDAAKRLERVLWNDPASGVWRHADAGYETAIDCAKERGLRLPTILGN